MPDAMPLVPEITNEDIEWVRDLMRLDDLDAPRRAFLAARSTLDISACPGSGKTTLVVAKLAILARKWSHPTKGICVLSHTNVAREQISAAWAAPLSASVARVSALHRYHPWLRESLSCTAMAQLKGIPFTHG